MLNPKYWECDELDNVAFQDKIKLWERIFHITIPLMDRPTCEFFNTMFVVIIVSGVVGAVVNLVFIVAYIVKFFKNHGAFTEADILVCTVITMDFFSALFLHMGGLFFINQPHDSSKLLIQSSCDLVYAGYTLGSRTTYILMLFVGITRYFAICKPRSYFKWFRKENLKYYLIVLVFLALGQMAAQCEITCHYPVNKLYDYNFLEAINSTAYVDEYNYLKVLWTTSYSMKCFLVMSVLLLTSILYWRILVYLNNARYSILMFNRSDDENRIIKQTFIGYLVYLCLIMIPQAATEAVFTYILLAVDNPLADSPAFYAKLRNLVLVQFGYSAIYLLNTTSMLFFNPIHRATISNFFIDLATLFRLRVCDEGSFVYRWRWQKPRTLSVSANSTTRWNSPHPKLIDLYHSNGMEDDSFLFNH